MKNNGALLALIATIYHVIMTNGVQSFIQALFHLSQPVHINRRSYRKSTWRVHPSVTMFGVCARAYRPLAPLSDCDACSTDARPLLFSSLLFLLSLFYFLKPPAIKQIHKEVPGYHKLVIFSEHTQKLAFCDCIEPVGPQMPGQAEHVRKHIHEPAHQS